MRVARYGWACLVLLSVPLGQAVSDPAGDVRVDGTAASAPFPLDGSGVDLLDFGIDEEETDLVLSWRVAEFPDDDGGAYKLGALLRLEDGMQYNVWVAGGIGSSIPEELNGRLERMDRAGRVQDTWDLLPVEVDGHTASLRLAAAWFTTQDGKVLGAGDILELVSAEAVRTTGFRDGERTYEVTPLRDDLDDVGPLAAYAYRGASASIGQAEFTVVPRHIFSNGEARIYEVTVMGRNAGPALAVDLDVQDPEPSWEVVLERPTLPLPAGGESDTRFWLIVPFQHRHVGGMPLNVSLAADGATTVLTLVVNYPAPAQPAGHHPRLFLSAERAAWSTDPAAGGTLAPTAATYFAAGPDGSPGATLYSFDFPLSPALLVDLDIIEQHGEANFAFSTELAGPTHARAAVVLREETSTLSSDVVLLESNLTRIDDGPGNQEVDLVLETESPGLHPYVPGNNLWVLFDVFVAGAAPDLDGELAEIGGGATVALPLQDPVTGRFAPSAKSALPERLPSTASVVVIWDDAPAPIDDVVVVGPDAELFQPPTIHGRSFSTAVHVEKPLGASITAAAVVSMEGREEVVFVPLTGRATEPIPAVADLEAPEQTSPGPPLLAVLVLVAVLVRRR